MEVYYDAGEILGIVPKKTGTEEYIGTDIAQYCFVKVVFCDVGLSVTYRRKDGHSEDAVASEGPVVAVADADGIVLIADFVEEECCVDALGDIG